MQFGLNQIGVVEYRIEGDEVEAYFRSIPTVVEDEPFNMPAFMATMARDRGGDRGRRLGARRWGRLRRFACSPVGEPAQDMVRVLDCAPRARPFFDPSVYGGDDKAPQHQQ